MITHRSGANHPPTLPLADVRQNDFASVWAHSLRIIDIIQKPRARKVSARFFWASVVNGASLCALVSTGPAGLHGQYGTLQPALAASSTRSASSRVSGFFDHLASFSATTPSTLFPHHLEGSPPAQLNFTTSSAEKSVSFVSPRRKTVSLIATANSGDP